MNSPAIRFAGFTDAWEERKLSDYLETSNEKNIADLYTKQDVLSVSGDVGIVNQIEFQGRSFAGASVSNYGVVNPDDVVYTKSPLSSNPFGIIKTNKGKAGIVSTLYAVYLTKKNTYPSFIQDYFSQNARVNNYLHPLVNKGAKNDMKISADNALKGFVWFPYYDEQKRISEFFSNIDRLITLHQREHDKTVNIKKALLEKMFPKDGKDKPEIRFAGFTDAWEQRKAIDIAPLQRGFDLPVSEMQEGDYPVVMSNGIGAYHAKYKAKAPGVVTGRSGTIGNLTFVKTDYWPHNTALWVTDFKGNDAEFVFYLYQKLDLKRFGTGSGVPTLNRNDVHDTKTSIPSVVEQKKIAFFFGRIDRLITLHKRELTKLKNIKKALLEKMFV